MPKTDKVKVSRELTRWTEYTSAMQSVGASGFYSYGQGFLRYKGNGRNLLIETVPRKAFGRTAEEAEHGARRRAEGVLEGVLASVKVISEEPT